jgi:hypothetical protein
VDEIRENVTIVIESCGDMSLEEYVAANRESLPQIIPAASISNEKDIEVHGSKGHQWIVRATVEGLNLKDKQVFFVAREKGYVLTLTASESTYSEYVNTFDEMVNSFVIE